MSAHAHVVSGGASGIGRATVELMLARGENVVVIDRAPEPRDLRGRVLYVQHDVTDVPGLAGVAAGVLDVFPLVTSVVASAGLGLSQQFHMTPVDEWRAVLDTNISGTIGLVQSFVPALARGAEELGSTTVVTIGSVVDENYYPGSTVFGASSAALQIFASHLRRELRDLRIRVANVSPGYVRSPWAQALTLTADDYERLGADLITVEDVAAIIDYVLHQPKGVVVHDVVVVSTKQGWG